MFQKIRLIFLTVLLSASFITMAGAQTDSGESTEEKDTIKVKSRQELVITATKSVIYKNETGSSITVISEDDIKNSGKINVGEILKRVPGITVHSSSVLGGESRISIRGARSENVLVLIDGVEVNDPISDNRAFDFANLTTDNVERIEIIRGPQSVLYGSDASGGVINIITKKGDGKPAVNLSFEGGSNFTFIESLSVNGNSESASYSASLSRTDSKGISRVGKQPGDTSDPEKDSYRNTTASTIVGINPTKTSLFTFSFHYNDAQMDADDGDLSDDPNHLFFSESLSAMVKYSHSPFSFWRYSLTLSQNTITRRDEDFDTATAFVNSWFQGKTRKGEFQNVFLLGEIDSITIGAEYEEDRGDALTYADYGFGASNSELKGLKVNNTAYYIQNHLKLMKRLFFIAGARVDQHEEYGNDFNYNTSLSYIIKSIDLRLKGNYGTGYKAPTLYQLYEPTYGDTALKPEESKNYDAGFEQSLFDDMIILEGTYFANKFKNKIIFGSSFKYENTGEVDTSGVETALRVNIMDIFNISGTYTYTKTEDKSTGERLIRMPEHTASMTLNWKFMKGGNINVTGIYVGERDDAWWDAFYVQNNVTMDSYYKIDLAASYRVTENLQLTGRVENLTNRDYQETYGYETPGISFYGGLKATF